METQSTKSEPAPPLAETERPAKEAEASVTLPSAELAWAQARAEREGTTVAAVVTDVVRKARQAEALGRLLTKLGADEVSPEAMAEVRAEFYGPR